MKIAVMAPVRWVATTVETLARAGHEVVLVGARSTSTPSAARGCTWRHKASMRSWPSRPTPTPRRCQGRHRALLRQIHRHGRRRAPWPPHLGAGTLVLSLQNGVDNAERLQAELPQRVAPAVVYVATEMAGPGHVRHHGRGELVVGPATSAKRSTAISPLPASRSSSPTRSPGRCGRS